MATTRISINNTAYVLIATASTTYVQNVGIDSAYIKYDAAVGGVTDPGFVIEPNGVISEFTISTGENLYALANGATGQLIVSEVD